jgi:L-alanine-DL-glutamate epimerase-like enolase superfamily enzyme
MPRIARIDLYPCRYPVKGYFKFFISPLTGSPQGRAAVIVKITSDDGTVGWGQSIPIETWSYETLESSFVVMRDYFAPLLIGSDPTDIEGACTLMDRAVAPSFSTGMPLSRAGIDIALHDLSGKLSGQNLGSFFGAAKPGLSSVALSWTVNATSPEEAEKQVDEGLRRGYGNFNFKVAPDPVLDLQLARLIKEKVPDGFLWADANGGYDLESALGVLPRLADAGVDVIEAPLRPNRIRGYGELKKQGALPIYMDEGIVSPVELEEFIALGMMDGIVIKPSRCGGLASAARQIELIRNCGLKWLGSGLADPDIALAASAGLFSARGIDAPAALNGPQFISETVLSLPLAIEGDRLSVPEGPGLGIEVDEEKVLLLTEASGFKIASVV